jgi:FG-GAP-like repeat
MSRWQEAFAAAVGFGALLSVPAMSVQTVYQGPITITSGGTYTGNWRSLDPAVAAVTVNTTGPVTIANSNVQSKGPGIVTGAGSHVTVTNTYGESLNPGVVGAFLGRFIDAEGFASLVVEHNDFANTAGIYLLQPQAAATISIRYNRVANINGRASTGAGYVAADGAAAPTAPNLVQFVQFDKVTGATAEIAWNEVLNDPYVSRVEDNISLYQSCGAAGNPIHVHDNYISGAYPGAPDVDAYSGGGIVDDSNACYTKVDHNQIIRTTNYGAAIASGSNNEHSFNTVIGTGILPDGLREPSQNVGMYVHGTGTGNTNHDNTVGALNAAGSRNDFDWNGTCTGGSCASNNTHLPDPVTEARIDAEWGIWQTKLAAAGVTIGPTAARAPTLCCGDFNGDHSADILWRNDSGQVFEWYINGGVYAGGGSVGGLDPSWSVVGIGDFNGDGNRDILLHRTDGQVYVWLMNGTSLIGGGSPGAPSNAWTIAGIGDFNGDGRSDMLWRNSSSGEAYLWLMNGAAIISQGTLGTVTSDWQIAGVGDFDGDGHADILWRNANGQIYIWFMNGLTISSQGPVASVTPDWQIAGVGDFNGDGKADILWRHTSGQVYEWLMNGAAISSQGSPGTATLDWQIAGVGDFNGDGKSDILWRQLSTGQVVEWLLNGATLIGSPSLYAVTFDWQIE